jgi:hypothetical protein
VQAAGADVLDPLVELGADPRDLADPDPFEDQFARFSHCPLEDHFTLISRVLDGKARKRPRTYQRW